MRDLFQPEALLLRQDDPVFDGDCLVVEGAGTNLTGYLSQRPRSQD